MIALPARVVVVNALLIRGDQVVVGAGFVAHEDHRGDVERQLLDRRVEQEARVVGRPVVGDDLRGDPVDVLDVAGQPAAGERLLHDPAVIHVLVEVEQHQAAVEERADHRTASPAGSSPCSCWRTPPGWRRVPAPRRRTAPVSLREMQRAVLAVHLAAGSPGRCGRSRSGGPTTGRPESPITGLRPLPGGGSAITNCGQSRSRSRLSSAPIPGSVHRRGEPAPSLIEQVLRGTDRGHQRSWARGTWRDGPADLPVPQVSPSSP